VTVTAIAIAMAAATMTVSVIVTMKVIAKVTVIANETFSMEMSFQNLFTQSKPTLKRLKLIFVCFVFLKTLNFL